ncbi:MAG: hypothetical protein ACR2NP_21160 [Pirellulaceae bacterium]
METVVEGLNNPCSIAMQPMSMTPYVSDSGNGQIVKIEDGQIIPVITGFAVSQAAADIGGEVGPLGLGFVTERTLVVGSGGWDAGNDRISLFDISSDGVQTADDETSSRSPGSGDATASEDYLCLAVAKDFVLATSRGGTSGGITRVEIKDNRASRLTTLVDAEKATGVSLPTAITISPDGFVVVGMRGEKDKNSVLAFFDMESGDLRAQFDTTLTDIVALVYAARTGRLYALNRSDDTDVNGLYKLVGRRRNTACDAQLVLQIDQPSAMACTQDGYFFVTTGGQDGKLLRLGGLDERPAED